MRIKQILALCLGALMLSSCTVDMERDEVDFTNGVRLTAVHTGDIHSRILPYDMDLMTTDERLGMVQANEPFGGFARMATVIKNIRANAQHSIHVDSGDVFQGAPIFNEFHGDPEIACLNEINMDAFIIGNHEFDDGASNLYDKLSRAQFTILAANYQWRATQGDEMESLSTIAKPYTIVHADGLNVAVIGMANYSSMSSITYGDNGLGIVVLENTELVQSYLDMLKNEAHILTMVTHLGLGEDEDVIRNTTGLDIVFGGHLHIVLNPPKIIPDATKKENGELAYRMVPLVHSGAFAKYVGHFDGIFYPKSAEEPNNLELVSHDYEVIPIDSTIPNDANIDFLLAPYEMELARRIDLRRVVGYAPQTLRRFGTGGDDSPLGNFLADNMVYRNRVEADFGATNSLGIRTDILQGPVTNDQLYNVFPFPNEVTTMTLSGTEVWTLLDYNTYRSMNRGCQSQLQLSGVRYTLDCHTAKKVVDAYLKKGYLFEYAYRMDAFDVICKTVHPTPSYCILEYDDPTDSSKDVYNVHFAKNIRMVRDGCEQDSDCPFYEDGIARCETINDSIKGAYKACTEDLQPKWYYKFATNNYMARGGSGFSSLRYNTTQQDTGVALRDITLDGIEKQATCVERCIALQGNNFDYENIGSCGYMTLCRDDVKEYRLRWCSSLYKYSPRVVCLENIADLTNGKSASCYGLSTKSEYETCLETSYKLACGNRYFTAKVEACREAQEQVQHLCAGKSQISPFEKCASEFDDYCGGLSNESEYSKCEKDAQVWAENLCNELPCFVSGTDGRQNPERPRNDDGIAETSVSSFSNGPAIMEALQNAGYDACY